MESNRCPVRYKKLVLIPTTWRKAKRLVKIKKGVFVKDKVLGTYLKLKYNPIREGDIPNENQELTLGIDPGSMFDGYTIISKLDNRNFQFNHQLVISKSLKSIMNKRIGYRRIRRNRLRYRPMRIESRNGNKISNTSNYYFQNRVNMIKRIINLYPIKSISIEDVKFNHYVSNKGKFFSNIEIGKRRLYDYIINQLKLNLYKVKGKDTKEMRELLFPNRIKNKDKSIRNFNSHCIDSYSIGVQGYLESTKDYRTISNLCRSSLTNTSVRFIDRIKYTYRRELYQHKSLYKDKKYYFRYKSNGVRYNIDHKSKLKRIRVKINDTKSNHGKIWNYMYTSPELTYKEFNKRYGGTISSNGLSKYWNGKYYKYYNLEII